MKKLLFAAVNLDIGGIETALVTLLNFLIDVKENNNYKYDVTLVLEEKRGIFLDTLNSRVKIIEYTPSRNKIIIIRKVVNLLKRLKFRFKYRNRFDFSCCYATYSLPANFVARTASKNSALWCHMDYLSQYNGDKEKVKEFFNKRRFRKFKNLVFVSNKSKNTFLEVFPDMESRTFFINNLVDYNNIKQKSLEKIDKKIEKNGEIIFLNVGRHDEEQKRLTRLLEACNILKNQGKKFKMILIGDGKDTEKYKKIVSNYKMEDIVFFLGKKKNPYPYYNMCDCVVITSDYEGSPVVLTEAIVLDKPIITTDVAGSEQVIDKYGIVVKKDVYDLASKMQEFIINGFEIKEKFNPNNYNKEILMQIENII